MVTLETFMELHHTGPVPVTATDMRSQACSPRQQASRPPSLAHSLTWYLTRCFLSRSLRVSCLASGKWLTRCHTRRSLRGARACRQGYLKEPGS
jgi:hypothetical protein